MSKISGHSCENKENFPANRRIQRPRRCKSATSRLNYVDHGGSLSGNVHECNGQCITPIPLRMQSLSGRRKSSHKTTKDKAKREGKPNQPQSILKGHTISLHSRNLLENLYRRLKRLSVSRLKAIEEECHTNGLGSNLHLHSKSEEVGIRSLSLAGVAHHISSQRCNSPSEWMKKTHASHQHCLYLVESDLLLFFYNR